MDFYAILGIEITATVEEVKEAYRKLAFSLHPDRNPGDKDAESRFKQVQQAYEYLTDPTKRTKYDSKFKKPSSYKPFEDIYDSVFNKPQVCGRNIQLTVEIELKDVLLGVTKTVLVPKKEKCNKCDGHGFTEFKPCETCHGSGKTAVKQSPFNIWSTCHACRGLGRAGAINCNNCIGCGFATIGDIEVSITIPPGIETGHQIRINGYGEPSRHTNGKNGDLNVIVLVKEHKIFKRHGVNLTYEFPVGFAELCLGANVEVPILTGTTIIQILPKTQDFTQIRVKGLGLPYFKGGKGDLIVILKLNIDDKINKDILENLMKIEEEHLKIERKKFKLTT